MSNIINRSILKGKGLFRKILGISSAFLVLLAVLLLFLNSGSFKSTEGTVADSQNFDTYPEKDKVILYQGILLTIPMGAVASPMNITKCYEAWD